MTKDSEPSLRRQDNDRVGASCSGVNPHAPLERRCDADGAPAGQSDARQARATRRDEQVAAESRKPELESFTRSETALQQAASGTKEGRRASKAAHQRRSIRGEHKQDQLAGRAAKSGVELKMLQPMEVRGTALGSSPPGSSSGAGASTMSSSAFGGSRASSIGGTSDGRPQNTVGSTPELKPRWQSSANGTQLLGCNAISRSMLELDKMLSEQQPKGPFKVVWQNLSFSYEQGLVRRAMQSSLTWSSRQKLNKQQRPVLDRLSGGFRSNELVAVIGPSGCGKTTLLQFLAGNRHEQRERVRILGLAEPKSAFIGQDDNLLPGLTARETLIYASRLQNSRRNFDHAAHIAPVLAELGLVECAEREVSKLSGGQAKRVAIAQELLYPTNLLILDEVTSGLDATTSYSIVRLLKYLAADTSYPMSIVMSIHQPSARLFAVFDRVYVMSAGQCLYSGSCQLERIGAHLARFGLECPRYHNIADYLIELACVSGADEHEEDEQDQDEKAKVRSASAELALARRRMAAAELEQAERLLSAPARSLQLGNESPIKGALLVNFQLDEPTDVEQNRELQQVAPTASLYDAIEAARSKRQRPFCDQFLVHLERSLKRIRRSLILTYLQLLTYLALGLQLATFYGPDIGQQSGCPRQPMSLASFLMLVSSTPVDSSSSAPAADELTQEAATNEMRRIQENMNLLLVTVLTATFAALEITVITFPMEARTIKREWRNGWYRVTSYFLGRTLADLPFSLSFLFAFSALVYVMTGQIGGLTSWRFGYFLCAVIMTALIAQSFGFIFGAAFMDNLPAAVFMAPLAIFPSLLYSGFFSRVSQIPAFYRPFTHLSHFRYTFDALLITLYGANRCQCDQEALDKYQRSLTSERDSLRDMFSILFGSNECTSPEDTTTTTSGFPVTTSAPELASAFNSSELIAHEDLAAVSASNSTLGALLSSTIAQSTSSAATLSPRLSASTNPMRQLNQLPLVKTVENAIVDSLFEQLANSTSTNSSALSPTDPAGLNETMTTLAGQPLEAEPTHRLGAMDRISLRFGQSITRMLSKQANFGRPMPTSCASYNSYLLQEFELNDESLVTTLCMLLLFVLGTRLLCGLILNYTIATRAR